MCNNDINWVLITGLIWLDKKLKQPCKFMSNGGNFRQRLPCRSSTQSSKQIASREQDVASTADWPLTSSWVCISLSRETLLSRWHLTITEQEAAECSCTTYSPTLDIHTCSKVNRSVQLWCLGLLLGCGQRGNGCFPSPATALCLNWSGLLDLSVCAQGCVLQ